MQDNLLGYCNNYIFLNDYLNSSFFTINGKNYSLAQFFLTDPVIRNYLFYVDGRFDKIISGAILNQEFFNTMLPFLEKNYSYFFSLTLDNCNSDTERAIYSQIILFKSYNNTFFRNQVLLDNWSADMSMPFIDCLKYHSFFYSDIVTIVTNEAYSNNNNIIWIKLMDGNFIEINLFTDLISDTVTNILAEDFKKFIDLNNLSHRSCINSSFFNILINNLNLEDKFLSFLLINNFSFVVKLQKKIKIFRYFALNFISQFKRKF
jgi:hypothetical protein